MKRPTAKNDEQLTGDEVGSQRAELLPDREVMSVLSDPMAMKVPAVLGGTGTPDPGAADHAAGTASGATDATSAHMPTPSPGDGYSPSETATAT